MIADNRLALDAGWDEEMLALELAELSESGYELALTGFDGSELERLWVVDPAHPIVDGLPEYFELKHTEMYGERFDIPAPDTLVFISWFEGGEVFRSGCCFHRGAGRVFYFRPGHETYPIYHNPHVLRVITNAVRWTAGNRLRKDD